MIDFPRHFSVVHAVDADINEIRNMPGNRVLLFHIFVPPHIPSVVSTVALSLPSFPDVTSSRYHHFGTESGYPGYPLLPRKIHRIPHICSSFCALWQNTSGYGQISVHNSLCSFRSEVPDTVTDCIW